MCLNYEQGEMNKKQTKQYGKTGLCYSFFFWQSASNWIKEVGHSWSAEISAAGYREKHKVVLVIIMIIRSLWQQKQSEASLHLPLYS